MANYTLRKKGTSVSIVSCNNKWRGQRTVLTFFNAQYWLKKVFLLKEVVAVLRKNGKYDVYVSYALLKNSCKDKGFRLLAKSIDFFKYNRKAGILVLGIKHQDRVVFKVVMLREFKFHESRRIIEQGIERSPTIEVFENVQSISIVHLSETDMPRYDIFAVKINGVSYIFSKNNYFAERGKNQLTVAQFSKLEYIIPIYDELYKIRDARGESIINKHLELEFGPYKSIEPNWVLGSAFCGFLAKGFDGKSFWLNFRKILGARCYEKTEIPFYRIRRVYNCRLGRYFMFCLRDIKGRHTGAVLVNCNYEDRNLGRNVYAISFEENPSKILKLYKRMVDYGIDGKSIISFKDIWKLDDRFVICEVSNKVSSYELCFKE